MRKLSIIVVLVGTMLVSAVGSSMADWIPYVIRNASDGSSPVISDVTKSGIVAKEFGIAKANMKAAWGNNAMDGKTVGELQAISIDRLDDTTRFTAGSGGAVAPYFNIWITNGAGKYAVIANEPSNAEWQPGNKQWNMTWDILKSKTLKVYETADKSWLPNNGLGLKFDDVKSFVIQAPTAAEFATNWTGLGTGAPREIVTNNAYGFNWIFGDTQANYVSGSVEGFVVANPTVVPEPGTLALLGMAGLGLLGYAWRRRVR